jgi:uncharacterized protein (DUF1015 family)
MRDRWRTFGGGDQSTGGASLPIGSVVVTHCTVAQVRRRASAAPGPPLRLAQPGADVPAGHDRARPEARAIVRFPPVPSIHPFRALRYSPEVVGDLAAVVAPPYDVIGPEEHRSLLARDPRNVVRLDLPEAEPGEPEDERYRRAARTLTAWRLDGTLRRDPRAALYPYEQRYRVPGTSRDAIRRGFFARVRLEPFGPASGIRAHERTLAGAREDRYRLLRATGVNTSPVVGLASDDSGTVAEWLHAVAATPPVADLVDAADVRHRLWLAPAGEGDARDETVAAVCERVGANAITLADGHHRYETALRYCEERRLGAVEADPAWADILMLILEPIEGPLTVLPTHRVVLGLDGPTIAHVIERLPDLFDVEAGVEPRRLLSEFGARRATGGEGRFGLWTDHGGAILRARRAAFERLLPAGGAALRRLDVTLASIAMEQLAGIGPAAVAEGRVAFTMDAAEAIAWVDAGTAPTGGLAASAALLLDPTPASEIVAVAADGDVMPQKSTYIYPKAATGLVINPLE